MASLILTQPRLRRGWQSRDGWYACHAAAEPEPERPFAVVMLDELQATGEWPERGRTVVQDHQRAQVAELERQWGADPPAGFGFDADGPEAG